MQAVSRRPGLSSAQAHAPADPATLPSDRTFRGAWRHDGTCFSVDMDHARAVHRERMRVARLPLLAARDIAYSRADANGDATLEAKRQVLRDISAYPAIAAASDPDTLKAVWPPILGPQTGS